MHTPFTLLLASLSLSFFSRLHLYINAGRIQDLVFLFVAFNLVLVNTCEIFFYFSIKKL